MFLNRHGIVHREQTNKKSKWEDLSVAAEQFFPQHHIISAWQKTAQTNLNTQTEVPPLSKVFVSPSKPLLVSEEETDRVFWHIHISTRWSNDASVCAVWASPVTFFKSRPYIVMPMHWKWNVQNCLLASSCWKPPSFIWSQLIGEMWPSYFRQFWHIVTCETASFHPSLNLPANPAWSSGTASPASIPWVIQGIQSCPMSRLGLFYSSCDRVHTLRTINVFQCVFAILCNEFVWQSQSQSIDCAEALR